MRSLCSLVMIVRDEAKSIRSVLEAAKPWVDRWTVLDTGSTDGTQDIVRDTMGDLPGHLFEETFVDFATSRNRALYFDQAMSYPPSNLTFEDLPCAPEFALMLSGDEFLLDGDALRKHLENHRDSSVDLHFVKVVVDGVSSYQPRVFRTGSDWRYEGVVHETPYNRVDPSAPIAFVEGAEISHVVSDPERRYQNIYEKHIPLLRQALEKSPNDERSLIFLSQSCECLLASNGLDREEQRGFADEAITSLLRRLAIDTGTESERCYCEMKLYSLMYASGTPPDKIYSRVSDLCDRDPTRPETAFLRAEIAREMSRMSMLEVHDLYCKAVNVARAARGIINTSPVDGSIEWKCHLRAAILSKEIAKKLPSAADAVKTHIEAGIEAGGPREIFDSLMQEGAKS